MKKITEKQLICLLEDGVLCEYCPCTKESHSIGNLCEGMYCEEAKDKYILDNDLDYQED